jgi:hypothetical protein
MKAERRNVYQSEWAVGVCWAAGIAVEFAIEFSLRFIRCFRFGEERMMGD